MTRNSPLSAKLKLVHDLMRKRYSFIDRVAVALFDSESGKLKAFVSSNEKGDPLARYEFPLHQALSLLESIVKGPRVVNDLSVFSAGLHEHSKKIQEHGYKASYTAPITFEEAFWGFIFLNSYQSHCFTPEVLENLDLYCHIIGGAVYQDINQVRTLNGALKTLIALVHSTNPVESNQPDRMSRITRWITEDLVVLKQYRFSDEMIDRLAQFAALHDVGKITVPDSIISKTQSLTQQEFAIMSAHAERGLEMVETVITNFGLQSMPGIEMLRNIVLSHHERQDGKGYPFRLAGKKIPVEARIVAVADAYNGLTSNRPHRPAYSTIEAFEILERMSLDRDCLAALYRCKDKLETLS